MTKNAKTTRSIRAHNLVLLQNTLLHHGPVSRAQLSRLSGLSRPSVSSLIEILIAKNLVNELGLVSDGSGRPGQALDLNRAGLRLIGVEVGATFIDIVITDIDGKLIDRSLHDCPVRTDPEGSLTLLKASLGQIIDQHQEAGLHTLGVGIGLSSPLTPEHQDTFSPLLYPAWQNYNLGATIKAHLAIPVVLENDANLGAVGEYIWHSKRVQNLSFIKLDSGIGSGHIVNGTLMTGAQGLAGEIGHIFVDPAAGDCYCGRHGCLVQVLGLEAIKRTAENLSESYRHDHNPYELLRTLSTHSDHSEDYKEAVNRMAASLAIALRGIISVLNPEAVILGGQGAYLPELSSRTESILKQESPALFNSLISVSCTDESSPTVALGACAIVRQQLGEKPCFGVDEQHPQAEAS